VSCDVVCLCTGALALQGTDIKLGDMVSVETTPHVGHKAIDGQMTIVVTGKITDINGNKIRIHQPVRPSLL
jgi:hypothetical protein